MYETSAFPKRITNGTETNDTTAPPLRCARYVITDDATAQTNNGLFSASDAVKERRRRSGQKSNTSKRNGKLTIIGLHISPNTNATRATAYHKPLRTGDSA